MSKPVILLDQGEFVGLSGATSGDVLTWNGTAWVSSPNGNGTVTSITAGAGLSGGTITTSGTISMPNVGTAGSYGSASSVAVITTDAQGRVSSVTPTAIAIEQSQVSDLVDDLAGKVSTSTQVIAGTGLSGGGALSGDVTLSLPNVGAQGEYGSASSVAVVTTDQQGRVSAATTTTIAITQSQVADLVTDLAAKADKSVTATAGTGLTGGGTLAANFSFALDTFGTAKTDQGTATKTVKISTDAYGRVSSLTEQDIAGLDAGVITSGQLSPAQGGTGIDASAVTDGQLLVGGTGTLALQNVSQDGSLASDGKLTVTGLQTNPVSSTVLGAPDAGKALVWSGSEWQASTIQGGGGGGGLVLYMNYAASSPYPLDTVFDENAGWDTGAITVANDAAGTELARFLTSAAFVIEVIPAGIWDVNVYAQASGALNDTAVRAKVGVWDGSTLTILGTSDYTYLADPSVLTQYKASVYVPTTDLASGERIAIVIEGRRFAATTQTVTSYFGTGAISHVHSTLNAPGGTGLLKVVDGYLQSPASALVNADVASDAAIAVAKLAAGTNDYVLTTVAGVPTWSIPPASGVTSLTGTADQVLVDASSGTPKTGALTLTLPQSIASTSSPTFAGLTLDAFSGLLRATAGVLSSGASVSLTGEVTGTLPILNGGTNLTSSGASGNLLVSDGSAWVSVPMTGDATIASTGALALKNTGSAGTYGSASAVPVFVTDAQGRVTSATNTPIDFAANAVTSLAGTTNQVLVNGGTAAVAGAVTLTLPQSIGTGNSPTFADLTLGGTLSFSTTAYIKPPSDNTIRLQPNTGLDVFLLGIARSSAFGTNVVFQGGQVTGTSQTGGSAYVRGGPGGGTNCNGGNVVIEGGVATGSGTPGQIQIGVDASPLRTSAISIGRTGITTTVSGTLAAATAALDTNTTQVATTAYVIGQGYLKSITAAAVYAPKASPTFTGTVTIPTLTLTNPLRVSSGGTGRSTVTAGRLLIGFTDVQMSELAGSASGNLVRWNGALGTWQATSLQGTANQVIVTSFDDFTFLSLPQSIATDSTPTFLGLTTRTVQSPTDYNLAINAGATTINVARKVTVTGGENLATGGTGGSVEVNGGFGDTLGTVKLGAANTSFIELGQSLVTGSIALRAVGAISLFGGSIALAASTTVSGTITANYVSALNAIAIGSGGTNNASLSVATGTVYYGDGSKLVGLAPGTSGEFLQTQGAGSAPVWAIASPPATGVTSLTGTSGEVLVGGTTGSPQTGALTLTLPQSIATTSAPTFNALTLGGVVGAGPDVLLLTENATQRIRKQSTTGYYDLIIEGDSLGNGGNVKVLGGSATGDGGDVEITGGAAGASGFGGDVNISAGSGGTNGVVKVGTTTNTSGVLLGHSTTLVQAQGSLSVGNVFETIYLKATNGGTAAEGKFLQASSSVDGTSNFIQWIAAASLFGSPTAGGVVYGRGNIPGGVVAVTGAGTSGQFLKSAGASAPAFADITTSDVVSGTFGIARGGTNNNSLSVAAGTVYYGDGSKINSIAPGTLGEFLQSRGTASPVWASAGGGGSGAYDLRGKFVGTPASSLVIDTFIADRTATISSTSTNHKFSAKTLPSAGSVVLTVQRTRAGSTVTVFTATSSSADTVLNGYYPMTISSVSNGDILADDVIEVVMQAAAIDPAFSTPVWTISATA